MNKAILSVKKYTPVELRIFFRKIRWKFLYYCQSIMLLKIKKIFYCPIDDKRYRTFVKINNLSLSRDSGARARHRFIWFYLKNETELFNKKNISLLHISPEYNFYEKLRKIKMINYHPVDKFEPGYDYLSLTRNFDLLDENPASEKYDFIICNHVLEHIIDDEKAIRNLFSLLADNGTLIVTVPILKNNQPTYEDFSIISPEERKKHFGQWDHVRYYGTDISERFQKAGFLVKTVKSGNYLTEKQRKEFGIPDELYLFRLSKM